MSALNDLQTQSELSRLGNQGTRRTRFNDPVIRAAEDRVRMLEETASRNSEFQGQLEEEKKKLKEIREFTAALQSKQPGVREQTSELVGGTSSVRPSLSALVS